MPEVDGIGWVDRDFNGTAPNGLPFSTMAGQTGGGKQVVGFLGIGINYFRSPKFIQADGGWNRTVWMPKVLKDRVSGSIPPEIIDAIATEEDATNIAKLKAFLTKHKHPVVARLKDEKEVATSKEVVAETVQAPTQDVLHLSDGTGGGLKIILSNAKITIDKIIVKRK